MLPCFDLRTALHRGQLGCEAVLRRCDLVMRYLGNYDPAATDASLRGPDQRGSRGNVDCRLVALGFDSYFVFH